MNLVKSQGAKLIHKSLLNFYTLTTEDQKEILRGQTSFTTATERIKYLEINLPKNN